MVPVWIAVIFLAISSFFMVKTLPEKNEFYQVAQSEKDMISILAYRKAVLRFIAANPAATGTISTASLTPFWSRGYIHVPKRWQNFIDTDGTLYIYSLFSVVISTTENNTFLSRTYELSAGSELVGTKVSGNFVSFTGASTWAIPATIPDNSIVIIGK